MKYSSDKRKICQWNPAGEKFWQVLNRLPCSIRFISGCNALVVLLLVVIL